MDVLAHALWTGSGAKKLNDSFEKKNKPKISILWAAFWGVFPDLVAFTTPFLILIYSLIVGSISFSGFFSRPPLVEESALSNGFALAGKLYPFSHSIVIFAVVFLVVWFLFKRPIFAMLGWGLHIVIDVFSHSIDRYPTPFLFPISEWRFPYGISWSDKWFVIINYIAIAFVLIYFYLSRKKKVEDSVK